MPCKRNPDGSKSCSGGGFSVEIAKDGAVLVKAGDSLSKYSKAIEGDFTHLSDFKHRRNKKTGTVNETDLKKIENVNYIMTGETLYHIPTRNEWRLGFTPVAPVSMEFEDIKPHLRHSRAECVFKTLLALHDQPRNFRGKAGWYKYDFAQTTARLMVKTYGNYENSKANIYLTKFDQSAHNALDEFKRVKSMNDPKKIAAYCNHLAMTIEREVSITASWSNDPNKKGGTYTSGIYFGAWMENMIRTPGTLLRCFQKAYAPYGFK